MREAGVPGYEASTWYGAFAPAGTAVHHRVQLKVGNRDLYGADFVWLDEAKIASLLRHPNIARVYEFARAHGEYFIAMEFIKGVTLRALIDRHRQLATPMSPGNCTHSPLNFFQIASR